MVDKSFDPYKKWLAIPPSEQPPNHYRLLGVPLFEDDVDSIEAAANRQMMFVKQHGTGPHSDASQKILNELSTARLILLNADKKAAYDAQLKKKQQPQAKAPSAAPASPIVIAEDPGQSVATPGQRKSKNSNAGLVVAVVLGGLTVLGFYQLFLKPKPAADVPPGDPIAATTPEQPVNDPATQVSGGRKPTDNSTSTNSALLNPDKPKPNTTIASTDSKPPANPNPTTTKTKKPGATAGSSSSADKPTPTVTQTDTNLVDYKNYKLKATLSGHRSWVRSLAFSPDGQTLVSGGYYQSATLWDVATRKKKETFIDHNCVVFSIAFSPDGKIIASGRRDKTLRLRDASSGKEISMLTGHDAPINSVAFSPDGMTLASASSDKTVKLWDVASRKEKTTLTGHSHAVVSIAFSPDGKTLASCSNDKTVKLWDVTSRKEKATLAGHSHFVHSVAFSPDGKTLASCSRDKTVKLWDVVTEKESATMTADSQWVSSVAFSPNGKILAFADSMSVKLWDVVSGQEIGNLTGHSGAIHPIAFSPDGKVLVSGGQDKTINLWEFGTTSASEKVTPVDLLKLIDPKRDTVVGDFSLENGRLTWQPKTGSRLQIPVDVPNEYDLVVTSTRSAGSGLMVGLLVGGHQALAVIQDVSGNGFHYLDGKPYTRNESFNKERGVFQSGKESTIICSVRKSSVKITFDDKTLIDWKGDPARFLNLREWAVPNKLALFIGGNAVHSISKLELRPVGSSGLGTSPTEALANRKPIPDEADQKEAIALIKDLFKDEYAAAKKPEQKYELAKTLLQQGLRTTDDPVSKYVLLREARDLATDAGMAETALTAIEEIARDYEVDLWEAREKALSESASHARFPPQNKALVESAVKLVGAAVAEDRYALAVKLANMAVSAARKARDKALSSQVFKLRSEVTALRKDFETAMKAAETLKENPDDPAANFTWGSYLCFQKNDWPAGLPLLAKSNDTKLKQVIELDLKSPTESAEQLKVADAWWDWIESSKKKENQRFRIAAHYWYQKAVGGVSGLTKLKVEKRLKEIGEVDQPRTATAATSRTSPLKPFTVIPSPPSSPAEIAALNRKAAEWVLGLGGTINTSAGSFRAIAELPKQPFQISQIVLSRKQVTDDGLVNLRGLTSLTNLRLENAPIGDAGLAHLKGLTNLGTLLLSNTRVSDAGLTNLQGMTQLATIYLGGTSITGAGFKHFKGMTKLGQLRIASTQVNDAGLSHLQGMTSLTGLHLSNTQVSDTGIAHLKGLTNLATLVINNTQVSDAGLINLQKMTKLEVLFLGGTSIDGDGLKHLKGMTKLTGLRLENTQINDAGLVHLKGLTSLIDLRIENTRVGDTGLRHLKGLTNLGTLLLSNTQVSDAGLVYIKGMTKIKTLYLRGTRVTPNGVAKLQQALPNCKISR